jgi:hypothetical protein
LVLPELDLNSGFDKKLRILAWGHHHVGIFAHMLIF